MIEINYLFLIFFLVQHCHTDKIVFDTIVAFLDKFLTGLDLDNIIIITQTDSNTSYNNYSTISTKVCSDFMDNKLLKESFLHISSTGRQVSIIRNPLR